MGQAMWRDCEQRIGTSKAQRIQGQSTKEGEGSYAKQLFEVLVQGMLPDEKTFKEKLRILNIHTEGLTTGNWILKYWSLTRGLDSMSFRISKGVPLPHFKCLSILHVFLSSHRGFPIP